jgi:hypothetical protein
LKFIFNLLENYWNDGNRIVLTIESTLDICTSCRGYFAYLKTLAKNEGKILDIEIFSNSKATTIDELKQVVKLSVMEIKYLTYLKDNSIIKGPYYKRTNEPIQLSEIAQLENLYNEGKSFSQVLKKYFF